MQIAFFVTFSLPLPLPAVFLPEPDIPSGRLVYFENVFQRKEAYPGKAADLWAYPQRLPCWAQADPYPFPAASEAP